MMKFSTRIILTLAAIMLFGCSGNRDTAGEIRLQGTAEDVWGNKIDLASYDHGITLIEPFSPGNCGYCLIDGEFVELNYFAMNHKYGGTNFEQCLFNPQLDIYALQKGFGDTTTVLTYPVSLHDYHRDGFPAILAFRDGVQILRGYIEDYDSTFRQRAREWWPNEKDPRARLASGMKVSDNYAGEPEHARDVYILSDGQDSLRESLAARFAANADWADRVSAKLESQVDSVDLTRNLFFLGDPALFSFSALNGTKSPIRFSGTAFQIGPYSFSTKTYGIAAVMPNPYNDECYVTAKLNPSGKAAAPYAPEPDFRVWTADGKGQAKVVLEGRFAKDSAGTWYFSDSLAVTYANLKDNCANGVCPLPTDLNRSGIHHRPIVAVGEWNDAAVGQIATLGNNSCRFPDAAVAPDGTAGIAWEENGDILFARLKQDGTGETEVIEDGPADAYNPRVAFDGRSFLVVYVSDVDGYYHVYGRYLDDRAVSDEFRIGPRGPFHDIEPVVESDGHGRTAVAWTQWRANFRYPQYRMITDRALGPVTPIATVDDGIGGYINAWDISLAFDSAGTPYGTWNQHYPSTLCICGGPLDGPATTPQALTGNVDTSERGEYPSTAFDTQGRQWAVWATFAWNTWEGEPQRILAAWFNPQTQSWTTPLTISDTARTFFSQTPQLAAMADGSLVAVWSGRLRGDNSQWGIYMSRYRSGGWDEPHLISEPDVCSRAPRIAVGPGQTVWVVWHAGIGNRMTVRAFRMDEV